MAFVGYRFLTTSMIEAQRVLFMSDADAKLQSLDAQIQALNKQLLSYTEIPAFQTIRYYQLTLNDAGVKQSIRSLELYFLALHQLQSEFRSISFVREDGTEWFRISDGAIQSVLNNLTHDLSIRRMLALEQSESHLLLNETQARTISWAMPVYTSATRRLGFLLVELDIDLFGQTIDQINRDDQVSIVVLDAEGKRLLPVAETIEHPIVLDWQLDRPLPLPGLGWRAQARAHQGVLLAQINRLDFIVRFLILPVATLLIAGLIALARKHRNAENRVHHLAYHDSLTGLLNRHEFEERLTEAVESARQGEIVHGVLYMDLDQFKLVNDTCGHAAGDELLRQLAAQLKAQVRGTDTLARLGGDEFALLLPNCPLDRVTTIADQILNVLTIFRFTWEGRLFDVGMSIGIVAVDKQTADKAEVMRLADMACYQAKELGRNRAHCYTRNDEAIKERQGEMQWVGRIKRALAEDRFMLDCQPIVTLHDAEPIINWELLVRMQEDGKTIYPGSFIPAAERFGVMPDIDRWVISHAMDQLERLYKARPQVQRHRFFINLSGASLSDDRFFPFLHGELRKRSFPKEAIVFEITETAAIANLQDVVDFVNEIRADGCCFALDDFGAGLSSFSYLSTIPIDFLKIDGSFVKNMLSDTMSYTIVDVINQIGHAAKIKTIAEFVESPEMHTVLVEMGIDYAQGFGIARPTSLLKEIEKKLDSNKVA